MTAPILVTGGTGTLGSLLVPLLREAGHPVRVLSRHARPAADGVEFVSCDLLAGEGIDDALAGAETVVHLAGGPKGDDVATRNLAGAAARTGARHLVYVSVTGVEGVPMAWLRTKLESERAVADSGVPWTTLRPAQFHSLVLGIVAKMAKMPVVPAPGALTFQPVDERDVAARLAELVLGEPAGLVPDLAGPADFTLPELLRGYLAATGRRRPMLPVRMPGKIGRAYREGRNLARQGAMRGTRTWEDYLAEHVGSPKEPATAAR
ncbi:NAD-dependent epimerase/dehydratase family protein [Actinomadura logoneensis]|uniref:NAD-dependent epimerase/dehydratase family protein n=1 Tax=Actinomadura logoneensis TaxID=2293572 RepID=A0A372JLF8_9ACTN|nr:SDR family oxidoreductase [Actinomadura logoneensis]RFU40862.1 NAD-dependent epimerase/dehydratase family protein [Actinomadura logoneensis]